VGGGCLHGLMSDAMPGPGSARGLRKAYAGRGLAPRPPGCEFCTAMTTGTAGNFGVRVQTPDASLVVRAAPAGGLVGGGDGCRSRRRLELSRLLSRLQGKTVRTYAILI
jgi:hypothetical protein